MILPLEWDSNFFNVKTGKLDAKNISREELFNQLTSIRNGEFQLVYIFAPHNDPMLRKEIFNAGGKLCDEKITYTINLSGIPTTPPGFIKSCKGAEMDTDLEALAIESGRYSRFRTDDKIPRDKFEDLYRLWMMNSLNGKFAKEVFAYEDKGKRMGMVSVDIRNGEGWIGIIAVNETFRGRAIGTLLMHAAMQFCKDNSVNILNVQTQKENKVSCAFYEKIGFRVGNIEDVFHLWKI